MSPKRATAYVGIGSVLAAWLAGASGLTVTPPQDPPRPVATSGMQSIVEDIQVQAARLRERMAAAPVPRQPSRNPFAFAPRAQPAAGKPAVHSTGAAPGLPEPVPEPPLQLLGIAEKKTDSGTVRTAMISADSDELFMLTEGETLGGRYRVKAVSENAVDLTDLVTGASRRLTLR